MIVAGCNGNTPDDQLQSLLHDEPLGTVAIAAVTASDGGVVTGSAGAPGAGGAGGGGVGRGGSFGGSFGGSPDGGGFAGVGGKFEMGGGGGSVGGTLGKWTFDDCNPFRTNLFDSGSFQGNNAFRAVSVACATGIDGQSVALVDNEDIVYVPDQPDFDFSTGVTLAAWFKPDQINKTRTLFRKRDDSSSSSFALMLNDQKYQFVINLGAGKAASVVAPKKAKAGVWTHVGATYDGAMLRLYIDGVEVEHKRASGSIVPGAGPLLMGNDGSRRLFAGAIDTAQVERRALSAEEVFALTCLRRAPAIAATPARSAPTHVGETASFDVAVTNNDAASCGPADVFVQTNAFLPGIVADPSFQFIPGLAPGATSHTTIGVSGTDDLDTGVYTIPLVAASNTGYGYYGYTSSFAETSVEFDFVASGCRVSKPRELMVTSLSVVDDPRTVGDGVWSFKHLVEAMAPTPEAAPAMVEAALATFDTPQVINGFTAEARPGMKTFILDQWPRTAGGALDLAQAPVTLQAIVNRFDLRNLDNHDAGEGRFVFAFNRPGTPFPFQATIIFEYKLPATTPDDVMGWANAWHALGSLPFPSEPYNTALAEITERFAGRGVRPGTPNGSAINAVRTNEIDFGVNKVWQLREFALSAETGQLVPATIKLNPDLSFNRSDTLASFVNQNEAAIIAETHDVPEQFQGAPFLSGAVLNDFGTRWQAPGITNLEARFHFGLNTCNGCHSVETGVGFTQITPRSPGSEAFLSGFLQGTNVFDPFSGTVRSFNDLARRQLDLRAIVCPNDPPPPPPGGGFGGMPGGFGGRGAPPSSTGAGGASGVSAPLAPTTQPMTSLTHGIKRVH